jgi:G3E family GTPase
MTASSSSAFVPHSSEARLPVTVVSGFLGSGKTTLVKHILTSQHGLRTAVIVNEFSELGIDSELIVSADDDMVELENGCICCSINNNFVDAIFRILARARKVDYLVVETTGLADPLPVVLTFLRSEFRDLTRVDSIITVADAGSFCLELFESEAARNQLRYGDVILLNKCDLVDAARLQTIENLIRDVKEGARIIRTTQCRLPLPLILSVGLFQSDQYFAPPGKLAADLAGTLAQPHRVECEGARGHGGHGHDASHRSAHDHVTADGFESLSFQSDRPFAVHKFQEFLERLPASIYRGKGLLWIHESDKRHIFHLVARRFSLDESRWDGPMTNKLVLIGRNLDRAQLRQQLDACLAPVASPTEASSN